MIKNKEKQICIDLINMMDDQTSSFLECNLGNNTKYQVIILKYFTLQLDHFESLYLLVSHLRIAQIAPLVRCMIEVYAQMDFLSEDDTKKTEKINYFYTYDEFVRFCDKKPIDTYSEQELSKYKVFLKMKKKGKMRNPINESSYYENWFEVYKLRLSGLIKNAFSKRNHDGNKIYKHYSFLSKLTHAGPTGLLEMVNGFNKILEVNENPKRLCYFIYFALTILELTINIIEIEFNIKFVTDDGWKKTYREQFAILHEVVFPSP